MFAPGSSAYAAASSTGTYGPAGTMRIDNVVVNGYETTPGTWHGRGGAY